MQSSDDLHCSDDRSQWLNCDEAVRRFTLVLLARTHPYGKRQQAEAVEHVSSREGRDDNCTVTVLYSIIGQHVALHKHYTLLYCAIRLLSRVQLPCNSACRRLP